MADFPVSWPKSEPSLPVRTSSVLENAASHIAGLKSQIDTQVQYQLQQVANFGRQIDHAVLSPIDAGLKAKPRLLSGIRKTIGSSIDNALIGQAVGIARDLPPQQGGNARWCVVYTGACYECRYVPPGAPNPDGTYACYDYSQHDQCQAQASLLNYNFGTPCSTQPVTVPGGGGGGGAIVPPPPPPPQPDQWCVYAGIGYRPDGTQICEVHHGLWNEAPDGVRLLGCFPTFEEAYNYSILHCGGGIQPTLPGGGGGIIPPGGGGVICPPSDGGGGIGPPQPVCPPPVINVSAPCPPVVVNVTDVQRGGGGGGGGGVPCPVQIQLLRTSDPTALCGPPMPCPIPVNLYAPDQTDSECGGKPLADLFREIEIKVHVVRDPTLLGPPPENGKQPGVGLGGVGEGKPPDCDIISRLVVNTFKIGSPEWCQLLDATVALLADIGGKVIQYGVKALEFLAQPITGLSGVIGGLITDVLGVSEEAKGLMERIVKCLPYIVGKITRCDPKVYVGIVAVRAIVKVLKNFRAGTDAAVWLTLDVEATFPQVEKVIEHVQNYICPVEIPGVGESIECWLKGSISPEQFTCWMLCRGADPDVWSKVIDSRREQPTVSEKIDLRNRQFYNPAQFRDALRDAGVMRGNDLAAYEELRKELPGPADMVRFAVRHVFEPSLTKQYKYDAEMPADFKRWHEYLGFFYPVDITDPVTGEKETITWADAHWRAHWVWPSPTQAYEMFFRLRPDRDRKREPAWMASQQFTLQDLNNLLRGNDYPPYWRPMLAAVAQRLPTQRQMVQLVRAGVWNLKNVTDNLLSMGYTPANADDLAKALFANETKPKTDPLLRKAIADYEEAWYLGIYDDQSFHDALKSVGVAEDEIAKRLFLVRVKRQLDSVKVLIKNLRDRFLSGELNEQTARNLLTRQGIHADHVEQYLTDWKEERLAPRRTITAGQAKKDACEGLLSLNDLTSRLIALGYNAGDISIIIAETQMCMVNRASYALAKQIAAGKAQKRELKQFLNDQRIATDRARQALMRHGTPAELTKWLAEGLISETEVRQRMTAIGWPEADITRAIQSARIKLELKDVAPVTQTTGGQPPTS